MTHFKAKERYPRLHLDESGW